MALHPLAAAFLAGETLPLVAALSIGDMPPRRDRRTGEEAPPPEPPPLPEQTIEQDEAAAVRAAILGAPTIIEGEQGRDSPICYGPIVHRVIDGCEVRGRLSEIHRCYPDQMEARRRARTSVPLLGWPPRRIYAADA